MGSALILIVVFVLLLLLGIPAAFSMGISAIVYFIIERGITEIPYDIIASNIVTGINSFQLLVIPLFLLLGSVMNASKTGDRIFAFANSVVGHFRGGLGIVNVLVSMLFAGMSGSGSADAAGLGQLEIKAMRDKGYPDDFAVGVTAGSSLIGPIIPPSIPAVLFAIMAGVSVTDVLLAGLIPGILLGIAMIILLLIMVPNNYQRESKKSSKEIVTAFKRAFLSLLTPIIIIGGILGGIFTATESAAIASGYALILGCLVYKTISLKELWNVLKEVTISSASIMFILASAAVFSWALTRARVPMQIAEWVSSVSPNLFAALVLISVFLLVIGCFLPVSASIVIVVPILFPVAMEFGMDPLAFAVFVILLLVIGEATPPFGMVLFIIAKISGVSYGKVARATLPYLGVVVVIAILVAIFPQLATFVPELVK
jgi:tripartite ATP-independent transporter DctM subunit